MVYSEGMGRGRRGWRGHCGCWVSVRRCMSHETAPKCVKRVCWNAFYCSFFKANWVSLPNLCSLRFVSHYVLLHCVSLPDLFDLYSVLFVTTRSESDLLLHYVFLPDLFPSFSVLSLTTGSALYLLLHCVLTWSVWLIQCPLSLLDLRHIYCYIVSLPDLFPSFSVLSVTTRFASHYVLFHYVFTWSVSFIQCPFCYYQICITSIMLCVLTWSVTLINCPYCYYQICIISIVTLSLPDLFSSFSVLSVLTLVYPHSVSFLSLPDLHHIYC